MPLVKINCLKIWDSNEKKIIHEAVHKALFDAFHIESWDYFTVSVNLIPKIFSTLLRLLPMIIEIAVFPEEQKR